MLALLAFALLAQAPTATPSPTPTPTAPASPAPSITVAPEFTLYDFHTDEAGAPNVDLSNGLLNVTVNVGKLHANATVGDYSFPTVGVALVPDNAPGANVSLYGPLPVAALTYAFDSHVSLSAGKYAALLGQESPFTYQNINIQRGVVWNMEPTISRGVQVAYTNGAWSATLQENDAYYSGVNRALEWLVAWSSSSNTSVQFAAIVPGANTPPNPTVSIGNKAEYDLMYMRTIGKLQLLPYFLWVHSPASAALGYTNAEDAAGAVLMGTWTFSPQWSVAYRFEDAWNGSSVSDASPNADLVGFGPGSRGSGHTITPTYHFANGGVLRLEYSHVSGTGFNQNRFGFEFGVMH